METLSDQRGEKGELVSQKAPLVAVAAISRNNPVQIKTSRSTLADVADFLLLYGIKELL